MHVVVKEWGKRQRAGSPLANLDYGIGRFREKA